MGSSANQRYKFGVIHLQPMLGKKDAVAWVSLLNTVANERRDTRKVKALQYDPIFCIGYFILLCRNELS